MSKKTVVNSRFANLTEQLKSGMDEVYFQMLGLDEGIDTSWTLPEDSHMAYHEAAPYVQNWTEAIEQLDSAAHELHKLQLYYYQRLHWPEKQPETPEQIIKHGKLIITFAMHRIQWLIEAYQSENPDRLKLLTEGTHGELTYKTIGEQIGHSAAAVAHWHKINPLPRSSTLIAKLVEFYGLSSTDDALYYVTQGGVFIPYHMIRDYRG